MSHPTPGDYVEALQFPDHAFCDEELASGVVETNAMGLPRVITGAYAAVFRVNVGEAAFAVRCFLTDSRDREKRYRTIERHLSKERPDCLVPFEFIREGIRVGDGVHPVVKMPWAAGEGLERFVGRHVADPNSLLRLRNAWKRMLADLGAARVAHGDLQHGNVLVSAEGERIVVRLVDYDAMWVPALAGRPGAEVGHRNYQHPDRTADDGGPWLDRFPGLVVYTALTALAERPDLWDRYATGENLLFDSDDFYDPASSALFDELLGMESVSTLASALAQACLAPPARVPTLDEVISGRAAAFRSVLPGERDTEPSGRERTGIAHWALPVASVLLLVIGALIAAGSHLQAGLVAAGAILFMLGAALASYRTLTPVLRRRRSVSEAGVLRQWIADLEDEAAELRRERTAFVAGAGSLREERLRELQDAALRKRLKHHFVGELADREAVGHRAVIRLKAAGVRNAFQATDERIQAARELTTDQRTAIAAWREGLARRYADEVPTELSAAEEQRLRRMVERRLQAIAAEIARLEARTEVQRQELAQLEERTRTLPEITPGGYIAYLLRIRSRPEL